MPSFRLSARYHECGRICFTLKLSIKRKGPAVSPSRRLLTTKTNYDLHSAVPDVETGYHLDLVILQYSPGTQRHFPPMNCLHSGQTFRGPCPTETLRGGIFHVSVISSCFIISISRLSVTISMGCPYRLLTEQQVSFMSSGQSESA